MEFQELLALAQKKQHKFDKEVERIDRYAKLREIERRKQLENAEKINQKCNSQKIIDIQKDPIHHPIVFNPNKTDLSTSRLKECKVEKKLKENPSSNSVVDSRISKLNGAISNCGVTPSKASDKVLSSENVASKAKQNRMSFAELLEIAKNNVDDNIGQKRPFEELIPCSLDSNYLKMNLPCKKRKDAPKLVSSEDIELKSTKSNASSSNKKVIISKTNGTDTLKETHNGHTKRNIENSVSKVLPSREIPKKNGILAQLSSTNRPVFKSDSSDHNSKRQKCVNDIKVGRAINQLNSKSLSNHAVSFENSKCKLSSNYSVELKKVDLTRLPDSIKVNEQIKTKQLSGAQASKQGSQSSHSVKTAKKEQHTTVKSLLPKGDNKSLSKSKTFENDSLKSKEKNSIPNFTSKACTQSFSTPVPARGIAAQLGVLTVRPTTNNLKSDVVYSTDDDYESEDSFIDDSEAIQSKDYARVVRDIHKALKFDPRKYKEVNPWDDLKSMEANYREIEKEERRSAKLGALEDNEEFIRDMLRKKQKHAKRKLIDDD